MAKNQLQPQDKYVLRLPDGMRDRIKKSAERSGRSMNAEIVTALEQYFPPEPTIEDVLERVHSAIEQADNARVPYRQTLIDALDRLSERLASGLDYDQYVQRLPSKGSEAWGEMGDRMRRWRRAEKHGVETADLERELERGMLQRFGGDVVNAAIRAFKEGTPERALRLFRLGDTKFAEPDKAYAAIDKWLRKFYAENWGDPDEPWVD